MVEWNPQTIKECHNDSERDLKIIEKLKEENISWNGGRIMGNILGGFIGIIVGTALLSEVRKEL